MQGRFWVTAVSRGRKRVKAGGCAWPAKVPTETGDGEAGGEVTFE